MGGVAAFSGEKLVELVLGVGDVGDRISDYRSPTTGLARSVKDRTTACRITRSSD